MHDEGTRIDDDGPWLPAARMAASDWTVTGSACPPVPVVAAADVAPTARSVAAVDGLWLVADDVWVPVVEGACALVAELPHPARNPTRTTPARI
ncbi:MAG: hypothetical protein M0Z42_14070 [Actinomycetota bacterium]|nr:hypothetical protein [Actinomycetota bacterium]